MARERGRKLIKKLKKNEFQPQDDVKAHEKAAEISGNFEESANSGATPNTFYGVLDTAELEYFKQAESTLAIDTFETPDEKYQFINSVIEESKGKELKLATSQICSKRCV